MTAATPAPETRLLLALLDRAYHRRSWHGTNLRGALRGMNARAASWRPAPDRHSIQEIVVHAAYWKYAVWRRLRGAKRGAFPLKGSNWFPRAATESERLWKEDLALLDRCHRDLCEAAASFPPARLHRNPAGSPFTFAALIEGAALHDLYHTGQIQLLKRLARSAGER